MEKYIVQPGDSVSAISKILYGDFSKTQEICKLNKLVDCNIVHPGQELTVPDRTNVQDAQVVSTAITEKSNTKTMIGKWFPWIIVVGAAALLAHEANKQNKKNKATAKPKALGRPHKGLKKSKDKIAFKFLGKNKKTGLYDFIHCTARGKTIDEVQKYIESRGWSNLEFQSTHKPTGNEELHFHNP